MFGMKEHSHMKVTLSNGLVFEFFKKSEEEAELVYRFTNISGALKVELSSIFANIGYPLKCNIIHPKSALFKTRYIVVRIEYDEECNTVPTNS